MERKPRICIAITTFYPYVGGAETQTLAQCQRLVESGYQTQVITFRHKHIWPLTDTLKGVPVRRIAGSLLGKRDRLPRIVQRLLYFLAMFIMARTIWRERNNFDVLQVCQFSLLVLPLSIVCYFAKKPMTIIVISAGAEKPTKTNESAKLLAGSLDPTLPWLQVDGKTWIDGDLYGLQAAGRGAVNLTRSLLKRIHAVVIVLSKRSERYLKDNGFDDLDTQLIPNGVDTARFHPDPQIPVTAERARTVVCVSKARWEKGLDVLLQAWHLVHAQQPEARLVIVGSGPVLPQLEQLAAALGITESVKFAGLQSDVPGQLQRGLIGILPSRWEGMPNALLEAMGSGLACIATRVSGSEDVIEHGVNGLLVESEDYTAMSQALLTLLQDPQLAQQYGAAASALIQRSYTLEHVLSLYTSIYQRLTAHSEQPTDDFVPSESCSVTP
ncbi:glycosyltransferase family 4 protein [Dictyobacter formicarum]|nr:glycosyltransferase family 4 protein [Dictyobacter formicarum]